MQLRTFASMGVSALLAAGLLTPGVFGQGDCPEPDYYETWVDPFHGDDQTGAVDDRTRPYQTINAAIFALGGLANPAQEGLVHALPGLYADDNPVPQSFPIGMRPYIHVQGAGAKECVLRVRTEQNPFQVYWPLTTGLVRQGASIAVDFTLQGAPEPSMFDGFTIQGADVQVYAETEAGPRSGRVSNCVFDMRKGGVEMLPGPTFGVLIAAIYFGENGIDYYDMDFRLFNNTFLQGVQYSDDQVDLATPESVAICNVNDPTPPCGFPICFEDPNRTIRGVSALHIQNNLIRSLDMEPRTAMLGIDRGDTAVVVSSRPGVYDSNAFGGSLVGGTSVDPAGTFSSQIVGGAPIPVVDLDPFDPGFVGEFHSFTSGNGLQERDARLLHDSVLRDVGASPAFAPGACEASFIALNGRLHLDVTRAEATSSFDFDGDGIGNPRIVGEDVDAGFDEIDVCTLAGSYGNDTKSHHLPYDTTLGVDSVGVPRIQTGTPDRDYLFAGPTTFGLSINIVGFAQSRTIWNLPAGQANIWTTTGPWTHMPGSLAFTTNEIIPTVPVNVPGLEFWLDMYGGFTLNFQVQALNAGTYTSVPVQWTNPQSAQPHAFHRFIWQVDEMQTLLPPSYVTEQLFINAGQSIISSNLMAEYL